MFPLSGRAVSWRVLSQMATVGAYTALVKAAGAAKVVVTARAFGMSDGLDAYLIAFLLPSFVSDTLAGSLSPALVPTFIELRERHSPDAAQRLYQTVLGAGAGLLTVVGMGLAVFAPWALRPLALHFDAPKLALTASLFLVMSPIVPLSALNVIWRSILNIEGHFALPAIIPAMTPLASIVFLLRFGHAWSVYALAAGTLAGGLIEAVLLGISVRHIGFPLMPRWPSRNPALDQVLAQYGPVIAGMLLLGGAPLIDQAIAGTLASGSVAALNYGTRLTAVLVAVGPVAVATAILPHFSKLTVSRDPGHARQSLRSYAVIILGVTLPTIGLLIYFSEPLVRLFFERGQFTGTATGVVSTVQRYSLLTIPSAMVMALVLRLISSMKANHLLLRAAVFSVILNLALDLLLTRWLGVAGIGLAAAIVQLATLIYLWAVLVKQS
jgi:putative peptidoglycan lipid II flippase